MRAAFVIAVAAAGLVGCGGDQAESEPAREYDVGVVFALDTTVHLEDGMSVPIDDDVIWSVELTSVGPLVAHGTADGEGGGDQRYSLITSDGSVRQVGPDFDSTVGGSVEPDAPYLAYPDHSGESFEVVVHDVARDREVARVEVPRVEPEPYLLWLDGDTVYVPNEAGATMAVDWPSGTVTKTATPPEGSGVWGDVRGGLAAYADGRAATLHDLADGEEVLRMRGAGELDISPSGEFAVVDVRGSTAVYDVDNRTSVTLPNGSYGWTADDRMFRVRRDRLTVCDPADASCTTIRLDVSVSRYDHPVLGGRETW